MIGTMEVFYRPCFSKSGETSKIILFLFIYFYLFFFSFPGFFLLLTNVLYIATVFLSNPVEDIYEIHDKETEVLPMNEGDAGAPKVNYK